MKSPAFQFYATDWLGSQRVQMMTLEEEGAYIRLVAYCWQHGDIPRDPEEAARLIGKGASTTLAENVLSMFIPAQQRGRLTHDRLEAQKLKQAAWRQKSAEGGRKSAEMRSKGGSTVVQPPYQPEGNIPYSVLRTPSPEGEPSIIQKAKAVFDTWNTQTGFAQVLVLSDKRRRSLEVRLKDPFFVEHWEAAMSKMHESPFLKGNNDRGWKADFDWFLHPDSVARIMEGKYNGKPEAKTTKLW